MASDGMELSSGIAGLDRLLRGLMAGDNVVWQVQSVEDYVPFIKPYCTKALESGRKLIYFRFARHEPLVDAASGAKVYELDPATGFESFLGEIHAAIEEAGRGAFYVFDCLSDLSADWYSDRMLGNFFMLTCPYLYDLETVTYFALIKDLHSPHAVEPIMETTQIFLDVYRHTGKLYVHPLKVQQRFSPTMHMLHVWNDHGFAPVTNSTTNAEILTASEGSGLEFVRKRLGTWMRTLLRAEQALERVRKEEDAAEEVDAVFHRLLRMVISRDEPVLSLAARYFTLEDLVKICKRMVGTGLIGGKSVGMLLARAILHHNDTRWDKLLEVHDSFYVGSDVFYTYLVVNGCWWARERLRDPQHFLQDAEQARRRILTGSFPAHLERQFENVLDYFGQSPIIVRSSSLLEDNFGNAFAGKYDSIFCVNQGSRHRRLDDFISAVKTIYASALSERALRYRARRGILDRDEQMALLIQRVSGDIQGDFYYPQIAGVGYSFNPYVWSEDIDPRAGMLRLVFGLGTRAVDRADDDYTRLVALNAPLRTPEGDASHGRVYMQHKVDALDLQGNLLVSRDFQDVLPGRPQAPLDLFVSRDTDLEREARNRGMQGVTAWTLSFKKLLSETTFAEDMRGMLQAIHEAYDYTVDVEFTANFTDAKDYRINLVQCRPFAVKSSSMFIQPPHDIAAEDLLLTSAGPVIGHSRSEVLDRIVYVVPATYGQLPINERYAIARLIGQILHCQEDKPPGTIMLLGPGRWGTSTPSLGVPVSFTEISRAAILCEIVAMREDLVPDVSLGTHFFGEMVEMEMLYLALFPEREGTFLSKAFFEESPNRLSALLPRAATYSHVIRVIDPAEAASGRTLRLHADMMKQKVVCYAGGVSA